MTRDAVSDAQSRAPTNSAQSISLTGTVPAQAVRDMLGAVNIPLGQLRARLDELPRDKTIQVISRSGQRAYATRLLLQRGFNARNVSGGMLSRAHALFFLEEGPTAIRADLAHTKI